MIEINSFISEVKDFSGMINVFTIEECQEITNLNINKQILPDIHKEYEVTKNYIEKAKSFLIPYLESKNIQVKDTFKNERYMICTSSSKDAKEWHYDDGLIINFIINLQGEGTQFLINDKIEVLPQGYGCIAIGDQGYTFLGLKPVLHCAPSDDKNRCLMKIMLTPGCDSGEHYIGESVCKYNSETYKKRQSELKIMLEKDLEIIKNIK